MSTKGKIYKIVAGQSNECYVGSTFNNLKYRFQSHKNNYKAREGGGTFTSSHILFEKYGLENCKMILIKEYEVVDRKHLEAYEQLWISKLKSVNLQSAFRIGFLAQKQYNLDNKGQIYQKHKEYRENNLELITEYQKQYYNENKEDIREKQNEYYSKNKDAIKEQKNRYYENNKETILKQCKEYRNKNKEKYDEYEKSRKDSKKQYYLDNQEKSKAIYQQNKEEISQKRKSVKVVCECGSEIRKADYKRHLKSAKHTSSIQ